jgi:hypothetical protein
MYNRKELIQHVEKMIVAGKVKEDAVKDAHAIVTSQWKGSLYHYNTHLKDSGERKNTHRRLAKWHRERQMKMTITIHNNINILDRLLSNGHQLLSHLGH